MDQALLFYFRRVRCLQYAAALVCLLRFHGYDAELVIGVTQRPFRAHAWVEMAGHILAGLYRDRHLLQIIERV